MQQTRHRRPVRRRQQSMSAFPLRVVFMPVPVEAPAPPVSVLVSVLETAFQKGQ